MKILHTSDWHLGHVLYGHDRHAEQQDMLQQILQVVQTEQPDVFLISGDIYHTSQPSATVQRLLADTLIQLREAHPAMTIIATAGNHDSSSKHDIFQVPWKALNVHTIGRLYRDDPMRHVIEIPNVGFVVAIPYTIERYMPTNYVPDLLQQVAENNSQNLPIVLMMHTTILGSDITGHSDQEAMVIGTIEGIDVATLGKDYDYLALGHIHRPQNIGFNHRVRYSGTPLAVSFDEIYDHSVSIITIDHHKAVPQLQEHIINPLRPLLTLPQGDEYATWNEAKELLCKIDNNSTAYIRLRVKLDDTFPSNAHYEANNILQKKQCRFSYIQLLRQDLDGATGAQDLTVNEFTELDPMQLIQNFFAAKNEELTDEISQAFAQIIQEIHDEERS